MDLPFGLFPLAIHLESNPNISSLKRCAADRRLAWQYSRLAKV